ncbi:SAGA-associated factor 11 [Hordeum vulgare]|nr:SAGA-associated factor 11 [Hordeum vulgare]
MVCMAGHFKMASVLKLMMENHATPDEVINEKSASHILQKQLLSAHEPNLLDEDDMHIFGSKPMADPLDLVHCDTCQKPVKASHYAPHAERCTSGKVNPNDLMGVEDDVHPMKPPKKGRKIKLTSNGNQKVHIKVKLKSQPENRNIVNDFELTNGNESKPSNSIADQRLKTSVDNSSAINAPERHFRDVPAPLATKMYHPRGNYRLRLELAQLYRDSCVEQSHGYASNTTPTSSQNNGLVPCDNSTLHGCHDSALHGSDNSVLHGARKSSIPPKKLLDQLLASTSGLCSGISPQLSSSGPSRLQATKFQRADTPVSAVRNELGRSRCNKAAVPSSKTTGKKKTQKQSNALPAI